MTRFVPPLWIRLFTPFCLLLFSAGASLAMTDSPERLAVFVQSGRSAVDEAFQRAVLPEIRKIAEKMGIALVVVDARQGAPAEIGLTPLLVYQNHRGRSIFQGRFNDFNRITQFLRTSRVVRQENIPSERTRMAVWDLGRCRIWSPLKIAPLTGAIPKDHDAAGFEAEARKAIQNAFRRFSVRETVGLLRSDRGFYMDFYPWLGEDGTLFLSTALFSQFHCKEPVFSTGKTPLTGPFEQRDRLFAEAARLMEDQVAVQQARAELGDGFDPIDASVLAQSWESFNLGPPDPAMDKTVSPDTQVSLPTAWTLTADEDGSGHDIPSIMFHFQPPLDYYRGEVTRFDGELRTSAAGSLSTLTGAMTVDMNAVTMGQEALDHSLRGSMMFNTARYPTARFEIRSVRSEDADLGFGKLSRIDISGLFEMKGKQREIAMPLEMEPMVCENGQPCLRVCGNFSIELDPFDIEKPDGPSPENNTVIVDVFLTFRPDEN